MAGLRDPPRRAVPPLIGREEVVAEFDRLLTETQSGHGQGLLVFGPEGSGKSLLLSALVDRAAKQGFRVLSGRGHLSELPPPFSLVRELATSAESHESRAPSRIDTSHLPSLGLVPFDVRPTDVVEDRPADPGSAVPLDDLERLLAPVIERDSGGREQLYGQVDGFFQTLAKDRPLMIAVDDLELADSSSMEVLLRLAIDLGSLPVAIVATVGHPAAIPAPAHDELERLGRSPAVRSTTLRPLTVAEVGELVRWITGGREPDAQVLLRWHTQTDGNPLFVNLLVRSTTGFRSADPGSVANPPGSLAEILAARFEELEPREQRVLAHAAALGREVDFSVLPTVTGIDEESVTESVDRLVRTGFLRESGREVYEFTSEPTRGKIYSELTETHRRILHQKIGLALEVRGHTRDAELARHFDLGHDYEKALKYNLAAADQASRSFAFEIAATHLARALEDGRHRATRDVPTEVRILTEEGRMLTEIGNSRTAETILGEAVNLARTLTGHDAELARALLGLGWARYERGEFESAGNLANEAWEILSRVGTPRDHMAAHRLIGLASWRRGDLPTAGVHLRDVLEIAEKEGTPVEQGHALVDVANVIEPSDEANLRLALSFYDQAAKLLSEGDNPLAVARVRMNRAVLEWEGGESGPALADFTLAIEAAEKAHSPRWIGWSQFNLAQMLADVGQTQSARVALERASRVLEPLGDKTAEQQISMARGMADQADRAFDAAEANYQESLRLAREHKAASDASEVMLRLALLSHDRGDDEAARKRLDEALTNGVLEYRPDFAPKVRKLQQDLATEPSKA